MSSHCAPHSRVLHRHVTRFSLEYHIDQGVVRDALVLHDEFRAALKTTRSREVRSEARGDFSGFALCILSSGLYISHSSTFIFLHTSWPKRLSGLRSLSALEDDFLSVGQALQAQHRQQPWRTLVGPLSPLAPHLASSNNKWHATEVLATRSSRGSVVAFIRASQPLARIQER